MKPRLYIALPLLSAALAAAWLMAAQVRGPAPHSPQAVRQFANRLLRDYPDALNDEVRAGLSEAFNAYNRADAALSNLTSQRSALGEAEYARLSPAVNLEYEQAAGTLLKLFRRVPGIIVAKQGAAVERAIEVPLGAMPALLYREGPGHLEFVWRKVSAGSLTGPVVIEGSGGPMLCGIELTGVPSEGKTVAVVLRVPEQPDANIALHATAVPSVPLTIALETAGGVPTEAAAGLYTERKRLIVPKTAVNFLDGGAGYGNYQYLYNRTSRYWPGKREYVRSFYQAGAFTVQVPAGTYRIMATKGPEFEPVDRTITVEPGRQGAEKIVLRRWIDMAARGWYSGDCHVHYERKNPGANKALEIWSRAEDVHMVNVLAMGDGRFTYYDQAAWGKPGWYVAKDFAIVPGQEDPRTNILGHSLQLNLRSPIRFLPESYYLYSDVFDQVHRQGGLTGYAHMNNPLFNVNRGLTIDVPLGNVDFAEFCEAGNVKPALYYQFLNLGYVLTAAAGSDVPYYGSIGDSRTYAYIRGPFSAEAWLDSFAKGHTFVTTGPMLELSVGRHIPGDRITAKPGEVLRIRAKVETGKGIRDPERLEIVVNGEVVQAVDAPARGASLAFELPARESMWIAVRCTGAHTTPVYVTVNGKRHWNKSEAPALIEERLRTLEETERLLGTKLPEGDRILWESNPAFERDTMRLRQAIGRARDHYMKLKSELGS